MPDRWEEINRIYDAALEVAEAERSAFLEQNCNGDEELRREVESLLAYDKQAQQFIDRPALQVTAEKLAAEPPSLVGRKLGPLSDSKFAGRRRNGRSLQGPQTQD